MEIFNKPGTKNRLIEMMQGVNKNTKININEEYGFEEYQGDIGDRFIDNDGNEFVVSNKVKGGVSLKGQGGSKEVSTRDLKTMNKIEKNNESYDENSDPFGGSEQKYQDGSGYVDEKPVNKELRVSSDQLGKYIKEAYVDSPLEDLTRDDIRLIIKAHNNITRIKGKEYAPTTDEIQKEFDKLKSETLNESTDLDKYENVVFLQGEEADEALQILNNKGEDEALNYLIQWHDPGHHEGIDDLNHGSSDYTYERDGYVMSWNPRLGYIGLVYDLSNLNESNGNGEEILKKKYNNLHADLDFSRLSDAYKNLLGIKDKSFKSKDVLKKSLTDIRNAIVDYLNNVKGIQVNDQDVQNFYTRYLSEKEEIEVNLDKSDIDQDDAPALDPEDVDNDGENLEGGLGDDRSVFEFEPEEILKGIEIEMEHTKDPKVALEIALDHLTEFSDYYTRLLQMEKNAEEDELNTPQIMPDNELDDMLIDDEDDINSMSDDEFDELFNEWIKQ